MNPEDLAITPDENFLIVAEFGGMAPLVEIASGTLSFFNIKEKTRAEAVISLGSNEWGSPKCSRDLNTPFGPHGLDLIQRKDGKLQLAVVSHYPKESIEMFELKEKEGWVLEWKGCVNVDNQYYFNDVSLDTSGNFYATHMFDPDFSLARVLWNVFVKSNTGMVVKWNQDNIFEELQYTKGSFPNGIALDKKNQHLIVNYNLGDKTVLFDLDSKQRLGAYHHNSPDNVVVKDGFAWVTNHDHSVIDPLKCGTNINCTLPFSINKLSLQDLSLVASYKFESKNMGVGTVGVPHDGSLWIGSYHSDRLAEANLSLTE
tara:strand:+ start:165 stop:1109 length:945 start_codon:yes stop_codon:yes gene_type:complete